MKKAFPLFLSAALAGIFLAAGCAQEVTESNESVQRRILESYIRVHYGDQVKPTESGMYLIELEPGTGTNLPADSGYVRVRYTASTLDGIIQESSYEEVARQLGTYATNKYYGPHLWKVGEDGVMAGLEELVRSMRSGGLTRGIIPPWLNSENGASNYFANTVIYDVRLDSVIRDRPLYETERLEKFAGQYWEGLDSLKKMFYFRKLETTQDTIPDNVEFHVRYVGRYLSGQVFDTNIADTAKRYRFYTGKDENYESLSVRYRDSIDNMYQDNQFVKGFVYALNRMNYGERAVAFFSSDWGYGSTSKASSGGVPAYEPLFFELWIEEKK